MERTTLAYKFLFKIMHQKNLQTYSGIRYKLLSRNVYIIVHKVYVTDSLHKKTKIQLNILCIN